MVPGQSLTAGILTLVRGAVASKGVSANSARGGKQAGEVSLTCLDAWLKLL